MSLLTEAQANLAAAETALTEMRNSDHWTVTDPAMRALARDSGFAAVVEYAERQRLEVGRWSNARNLGHG